MHNQVSSKNLPLQNNQKIKKISTIASKKIHNRSPHHLKLEHMGFVQGVTSLEMRPNHYPTQPQIGTKCHVHVQKSCHDIVLFPLKILTEIGIPSCESQLLVSSGRYMEKSACLIMLLVSNNLVLSYLHSSCFCRIVFFRIHLSTFLAVLCGVWQKEPESTNLHPSRI